MFIDLLRRVIAHSPNSSFDNQACSFIAQYTRFWYSWISLCLFSNLKSDFFHIFTRYRSMHLKLLFLGPFCIRHLPTTFTLLLINHSVLFMVLCIHLKYHGLKVLFFTPCFFDFLQHQRRYFPRCLTSRSLHDLLAGCSSSVPAPSIQLSYLLNLHSFSLGASSIHNLFISITFFLSLLSS